MSALDDHCLCPICPRLTVVMAVWPGADRQAGGRRGRRPRQSAVPGSPRPRCRHQRLGRSACSARSPAHGRPPAAAGRPQLRQADCHRPRRGHPLPHYLGPHRGIPNRAEQRPVTPVKSQIHAPDPHPHTASPETVKRGQCAMRVEHG